MKLYNFFRSGTSHRVRIALELKGLDYEYIPISLGKEEHHQGEYAKLNPQKLVPTLETEDGIFTQSMTIIEYLEKRHPSPSLYPVSDEDRLRASSIANLIACDIHPINNRRILEYLRHELKQDEEAIGRWTKRWIEDGFTALEELLIRYQSNGKFCIGDYPTIADICLVPQINSAKRFKVDLSQFPTIASIGAHCDSLEAFQKAAPQNQPDAF